MRERMGFPGPLALDCPALPPGVGEGRATVDPRGGLGGGEGTGNTAGWKSPDALDIPGVQQPPLLLPRLSIEF